MFLPLLLVSFQCISISTSTNHQLQPMSMDPSERETLFHVMESISSDRDWRSSNPDPCKPGSSWPGIECKPSTDDTHLHVTRLNFGNPPNPSCKQEAIFPSTIFDLPHLQSLSFLSCFKSTKTTLSISLQSNNSLPTLQQLSLKSNPSLVGTIPPQISSFRSLQVLTLSQSHLHGEIPGIISLLTSLIHLDLSYNSFSGSIPTQIGKLRSLVHIDLSYNSLSGIIPPSIGEMGLLQKLDLSCNSLTGAIPETIGSLNSLSFLALSSNGLSGHFPRDLPRMQSLQYLIMDDNPMLVPLPFDLGRLSRLQELRLANSGYSGTIPGSFAWLSNLTTLSLENNRLSGEIPAGLSGLSRMYHLNLSRNMLVGVVPFDAGFLKRLGRNLDLGGNTDLCMNEAESPENVGVGVCRDNRSASSVMQQPLGGSDTTDSAGVASSLLYSGLSLMLGLFCNIRLSGI